MDYLRTLGSAAVSSLVQKSGLNLPFTLGSKVTSFDNLWTLYDGTKRDDGSQISIFEYDHSSAQNKKLLPLAKNALRKLRTVRHPDVLKFLDVVETDSTIHIMTERVRPLKGAWEEMGSGKGEKEREDWFVWGLHRISVALAFVNDSCSSTHGNIRSSSIFIVPSGEWRLGGFEVLSNPTDEAAILYTMGGLLPDATECASPEIKKGGWSAIKETSPSAPDAYAFALLLHSIFNPTHPPPPTSQPPHPPPQPSSRGSIPSLIWPSYKKLLNPNPKARMSTKGFLEVGMAETMGAAEGGFFVKNKLVAVCKGLDNFALGSEAEKAALLRILKDSASTYPPSFSSHLILPRLLTALQHGGTSAAIILPLVLQLGKNHPNPGDILVEPIVKLYQSPDRGTRMALLDSLGDYVEKLEKKTVSDKVWPHLQTGFSDTVAIIREATVKSIILIAPKLNDRIMNNELLRHLAKMQMDPEASIRTNTCILIGRLGPSLGYNTKRKMLVPAFARALKDPFVHARVAGLMAFMASVDLFDAEDCATKVIPNVAGSLIDREKLVRDQAFKAVELFVSKLEKHAASMPETVIAEDSDVPVAAVPLGQATLVNTATGAAGALAGWAISSLGKKLATADMQSNMNSTGSIDRPISAPPPLGGVDTAKSSLRPSPLPFVPSSKSAANSTVSSPSITRTSTLGVGAASRAKGMQLGASKVPAGMAAASLAAQLEEEAAAEDGVQDNPWGTDDLIDINADEDDWSAFETATVPKIVEPKPVSASGSGFHNGFSAETDYSEDPWGGLESSKPSRSDMNAWDTEPDPWQKNPPPKYPSLSSQTRQLSIPGKSRSASITSSQRSTPVSSPPLLDSDGWEPAEKKGPISASVAPNLVGLSKEDKATELARRKEERKQRIALLKEQKKNASGGKA